MITFVKDSKETRDITPPFPPPSFQHRLVVQRVLAASTRTPERRDLTR